MPRPKISRIINTLPRVYYYKPTGVRLSSVEEVVITVDELEAVRLTAEEGLSQTEAAERMGISQPTIHRLILSFEKKIVDALVNGKAIRVELGDWINLNKSKIRFGRRPGMCICPKCGKQIVHPPGIPCREIRCPDCGTPMVRSE